MQSTSCTHMMWRPTCVLYSNGSEKISPDRDAASLKTGAPPELPAHHRKTTATRKPGPVGQEICTRPPRQCVKPFFAARYGGRAREERFVCCFFFAEVLTIFLPDGHLLLGGFGPTQIVHDEAQSSTNHGHVAGTSAVPYRATTPSPVHGPREVRIAVADRRKFRLRGVM